MEYSSTLKGLQQVLDFPSASRTKRPVLQPLQGWGISVFTTQGSSFLATLG
jgi:hypothetical protein